MFVVGNGKIHVGTSVAATTATTTTTAATTAATATTTAVVVFFRTTMLGTAGAGIILFHHECLQQQRAATGFGLRSQGIILGNQERETETSALDCVSYLNIFWNELF